MSKASEWLSDLRQFTARVEAAQAELDTAEQTQPRELAFEVQRHNGVRLAPVKMAQVGFDGGLLIMHPNSLSSPMRIPAEEAVPFARWILDVFGDSAPEGT